MQLTREQSDAYLIRAWDPGRILVADRWLHGNLLVAPDRIIEDWAVDDPTGLALADLAQAIAMRPEIILLGTGPELVLPDIAIMGELAEQAIGLEIMSTPAACRTYNVLVHEQRRVVAALFTP